MILLYWHAFLKAYRFMTDNAGYFSKSGGTRKPDHIALLADNA
jgi:hypothetical protein